MVVYLCNDDVNIYKLCLMNIDHHIPNESSIPNMSQPKMLMKECKSLYKVFYGKNSNVRH